MLNLDAAFASFPTLETPRLTLREVRDEDAAPLFRIRSNPLAMRYFGRPMMTQPEQAAERIQRLRASFAEREAVQWAVVLRSSGSFVGMCSFWRIEKEHARAEIGYELEPAYWGQGLMPEALATALEFAFGTLGLHSAEAHIHPANTGSRRVLEKSGFVQEGYFRENFYDQIEGRFTDTAVFSLLHADWAARQPAQ